LLITRDCALRDTDNGWRRRLRILAIASCRWFWLSIVDGLDSTRGLYRYSVEFGGYWLQSTSLTRMSIRVGGEGWWRLWLFFDVRFRRTDRLLVGLLLALLLLDSLLIPPPLARILYGLCWPDWTVTT